MQKPIDEAIIEESLQNYNAKKMQTAIKNTVVHVDKKALHNHLGLSVENTGTPWTLDKVAQHLKENAGET